MVALASATMTMITADWSRRRRTSAQATVRRLSSLLLLGSGP